MPKSSVKFAPEIKNYNHSSININSFNIFNILDEKDNNCLNQEKTSQLPPIHTIVWGKSILAGKSWADEVEGF
tara:strand:+ start:43 stop:261 length:219 start_codon:yes stop_codon:yes gene_type:complete